MADPQGISIAFGTATWAPTPTWTRLDNGLTRVASYSIDRGRQYELDRTDGGRAQVQISDTSGILDPTNSAGSYYGQLEPLLQAAISRYNPVLHNWYTRFRGFISDYDYDYDPSQKVNRLTLSLVDIFEPLTAIEMFPGSFGDSGGAVGQVFFDNNTVGPVGTIGGRLTQLMANATIPSDFYVFFSGNVQLFETTYSPGESMMSAMQEAADAEFPGVGNLFTDRLGRICFHGRLSKFTPGTIAATAGTSQWDWNHWHAGDWSTVQAGTGGTAVISEFSYNRGLSKIINFAQATPLDVTDAALASGTLIVRDLSSIGTFGFRTWYRENLLTEAGNLDSTGSTAATKQFAQYYVDNYSQPQNRVTRLAFQSVSPTASPAAGATWALLCRADIADQVDITMRGAAGTVPGFNAAPYYIEGIHEQVNGRIPVSGGSAYDVVTMALDVSPVAYFDTNPFPT